MESECGCRRVRNSGSVENYEDIESIYRVKNPNELIALRRFFFDLLLGCYPFVASFLEFKLLDEEY